jgi:serine/threonine protein kinase
VYRAERDDGEFEHEVAIKTIRVGMGTEENVERFRQERQILARLTHPAITRLLDGGVTPEGQPYLVMELVDGSPLVAHARAHNLPQSERLRLFEDVCAAVGYAHRHLVVHRDLKPSNVLVTPAGAVKLLDFGIAKLISPDADPGMTRVGTFVLTPEYAAPEQLRDEPVTTATDVFALGVILYELLAGTRPHRAVSTSRRDLERAILEADADPLPASVDRDLALIVARALA